MFLCTTEHGRGSGGKNGKGGRGSDGGDGGGVDGGGGGGGNGDSNPTTGIPSTVKPPSSSSTLLTTVLTDSPITRSTSSDVAAITTSGLFHVTGTGPRRITSSKRSGTTLTSMNTGTSVGERRTMPTVIVSSIVPTATTTVIASSTGILL